MKNKLEQISERHERAKDSLSKALFHIAQIGHLVDTKEEDFLGGKMSQMANINTHANKASAHIAMAANFCKSDIDELIRMALPLNPNRSSKSRES